jgi:hypothetical protein
MRVFATPKLEPLAIAGKCLSQRAVTKTLQFAGVKNKSLKRLKSESTSGYLSASKRWAVKYKVFSRAGW